MPDPDPTTAADEPRPDRPTVHSPGGPATGAFRPDPTTGTFAPPDPGATDPDAAGEPPARPPAAARGDGVGAVVAGRYTLVEVIGEGGMGAVYLASQTEPVRRQVALKLIKPGLDSKAVLARFDAERQALALMDHPHIARIYDGGVTPAGQPFFVMELVRGVPLTDYCDRHRLGVPARLELFVAVCRAVQHAHQKGVIHRDLKPGNVLVTEVDGSPTPKVIDFGVAKATEQKLTDLSFPDVGAIVGTPTYMSPEQADPGCQDIDTRTDVYSLGVMLYELLVGSPPLDTRQFKRGAVLEMLRMVREAEPPRPSTKLSTTAARPNIAASRDTEPAALAKLLRGELDWVVMKALEKDRTRRYDTADGLARDLQRYLADEVVEARPPSRGYRLRKFVRRHRGAVAAAGLVLLALLAGAGGIAWQWREAVHARTRADLARAEAEASAAAALQQRKVALDAVGQLVTTVRGELVKKPDLQGVLQNVLKIAQTSLDAIARNPLAAVSLNDTTRAAAHDAAARLHRDLGDTPAALAEFHKAAAIYQSILDSAADGPDKEVVKKNLVITWVSLGQTSLRTGSQAEARASYDRAARLLGQVDAKTAADYRKILVSLFLNLGAVTIDRKPREARENYLGALRVAETTAAQESATAGGPSDDTRLALQKLYTLLGSAESRLRDPEAADRYSRKALMIAEERLKAQPDDDARKRGLAHEQERTGDLLLRGNKPAAAGERYAAAATAFTALAAADPKNVDAQADLARIRYSQGLVAARTGDAAAAAGHFQASLDLRTNRVNLAAETYAQRDLMMSLAQVGSHREATALAETVRTKLPADPGALVDIACCYAVCSAAVGADPETRKRYIGKAVEATERALAAGYGDKVNLETEPDLDGVRDQAAFKALLAQTPEP